MEEILKNRGLSGIVNYGNTCYMNSAVQCLSNITPLTLFFINKKFISDIKNESLERDLVVQWYKLLVGLWSNNCIVSPQSFRREVKILAFKQGVYLNFIGNKQNDVQEFLVFMIDSLHNGICKEKNIQYEIPNEEEKKNKNLKECSIEAIKNWDIFFKNNYSIFIELFYSQISSSIYSIDKKKLSTIYEPCCFLNLPINDKSNNLYDCFNNFTSMEKMENENKWYNDKTKCYQEAFKKINFWKLSKIIIIVLKRFNNKCEKISTLIDIPLVLDLSKYCIGYNKEKYKYDLISISNHIGSLEGGHYYSYILNQNKKWYNYNDTNVCQIDKDNLITKNAYCLFYKLK